MKQYCVANRKISFRSLCVIAAVAMTAPLLMAQAGWAPASEPGVPAGPARIRPSVVHVAPGQQQQFRILQPHWLLSTTVMQGVKWSVNDIPGGNAEIGTIDSNGVYRAPEKAPKPHEIHICADAEGAPNRYLWATVIIGNEAPTYKMILDWGEPKSKLVHLKGPHGITIDANGNLIIADETSGHVLRYTPEGKFIGEVGLGPGDSESERQAGGHFKEPRSAAVDAEGNIFVGDEATAERIQEFSPDGKFLRRFALKGNLPGMILRPHGMQFDAKGRLFVDDVDNFRISVFDHSGKFLYSWGHGGLYPGGLNPPHGLSLDKNDDVFVNSFYGPAQKFTADGKFLKAFAYADPPDGPIIYHTLNGDRWGDVLQVVETLKPNPKNYSSIEKYNDNGDFVTTLRMSTPDRRAMWVAVANDGTVYALYSGKTENGVQVFKEQ